jgi:hypothetical protein
MAANVLTVNTNGNVRVRGIALPNEHGSWGFLFEPIVAAVAVAPSFAAIWISLLVIGVFLTRRPLKILLSNRKAKRNSPQNAVAIKFILLYGAITSIGLAGSLIYAHIETFIPFVIVIPLAIYQIYCDVLGRTRHLIPELTGAVAISSSAAVIALAGGWNYPAAFALWGIFIARLIPSIVYVRNRLRFEKGKEFSMIPIIVLHFIALGAIGMLAEIGLSSKLTVAVFVVLLGRAFFGLSPYHHKIKAVKIGIWEVIYGVLTVLSIIFGHYLEI